MSMSNQTYDHERGGPLTENAAHASSGGPVDWVWETDETLSLTWVSPGLGGAGRNAFTGMGLGEFLRRFGLDEGDPAQVSLALAKLRPFRNVALRWTEGKDEREHRFLLSGSPSWDGAGNFAGYRGVGVEIGQDALSSSPMPSAPVDQTYLSLFRNVMDAACEAVAILSPSGKILYANPAYGRLFGRPLSLVIGSHYRSYFPPSSQVSLNQTIGPALSRGEGWDGVIEAIGADGRTFPLWHRADALRDERGRVSCFFAFLHDHTQQQDVQNQLSDAKVAAEEATLAKTRFLAAASHDLRQPMQALAMFVAVLSEQQMPPSQVALVARVQESVTALDGLLSGLLDVSKLEAGLVEAHPAPFSLTSMLSRLVAEFEPQCQEQGLTLRAVLSRHVVLSDVSLLENILRNLLANAVRFTPKGGRILLGCRRDAGLLSIEVRDSGIGIPQAELRNIFREFYQVGNQGRDRRQGLGLGLAIAQRQARLLGHELKVESRVGKGSVFSVSVPVLSQAPTMPAPMIAMRDIPARGAAVLVIDDEPDVRESMEMLLESWGHEVLAAASAEDALGRLNQWGRVPELIVADYRLQNGKTGGEAIRRVEQGLGLERKLPAIIVTGDTAPERLQQARALGHGLLHKPVRADVLRRAIDDALTVRSRPSKENRIQ